MEEHRTESDQDGELVASVADVLDVARWLGRQLQRIPREQRHNAIAALTNKRSEAARLHGETLGVLMIDAFVDGWTDFPESKSYVGRKKP
ncbi:hypothetical protein [Ralstonia pseudosolanacearum]|uniref:hypothetical protein n=1 Tax=Ralstonia pseudosolanacearum TaxID=1310165 RepID=UPI000B5E156F|nr:hypothetical protein [Ralstonia pseudosolanacearum]ASL74990.1 hypothetical protein BC350_16265 [Ralstonia pseudosolanacearum]QIK18611.1 hypothetical protein G7968_09360 [Ralstonia solanacearum]RAA07508.1 hypothetical protein DOT66_17050 [Ralstonia pseudosolanacearum]RAA16233.1 hypothetical protein DOT79_13490 [Ralstonia pseudosolanacearum]